MADGKSQIAQRGECEQGELLTTDFRYVVCQHEALEI